MLVAIAYNINKRMHIHTHGSKGDPVIIILHPMGITGEKLYNSENGYNLRSYYRLREGKTQ